MTKKKKQPKIKKCDSDTYFKRQTINKIDVALNVFCTIKRHAI